MIEISRRTELKFALFVDNYDKRAIDLLSSFSISSWAYCCANDFMAHFYRILKTDADTVPFQLSAGSSQLAMESFWGGPNNITDLTFDPLVVDVLDYTWPQIEQHFATQLGWLQQLHRLTRDQLRDKMVQWYGHRWSPDSDKQAFNPCSVHQLMATGKFQPHWAAATRGQTRVLGHEWQTSQLMQSMLWADLHQSKTMSIDKRSLANMPLPQEGGKRHTQEVQTALLLGAGLLAIHPAYKTPMGDEPPTDIRLTIPNEDSKQAIVDALDTRIELPAQFHSDYTLECLIASDDIHGLLKHMNKTGAFEAALSVLRYDRTSASEALLSMTFAYLLLRAQPIILIANEADQSEQYPTADYVLHVHDEKTTHILAFAVKASRKGHKLTKQLAKALEQALKHKQLAMDGYTVKYSVVVFVGSPESSSAVEAITEARTDEQVEQLLAQLVSEKEIGAVAKRREHTWLV